MYSQERSSYQADGVRKSLGLARPLAPDKGNNFKISNGLMRGLEFIKNDKWQKSIKVIIIISKSYTAHISTKKKVLIALSIYKLKDNLLQ